MITGVAPTQLVEEKDAAAGAAEQRCWRCSQRFLRRRWRLPLQPPRGGTGRIQSSRLSCGVPSPQHTIEKRR